MKVVRIQSSKVYTAIRKAQNMRIICLEGSARSTKTFSVLQYLIDQALLFPRIRITASRYRLTWLKATVLVDFEDILRNHYQLWDDNNFNKTDCIYTFSNGSVFSFIGLDEPQKAHGRKQDIAWINEAMEADYKDFEQLAIRTTKQLIVDYNPNAETHWIYDKICNRDDCQFIKSTYKDNPFLSKEIVAEIEKLEPTPYNIERGTADKTSWEIYGLGNRCSQRGLIFSKMQICDSMPPIEERKRTFYGMDFGFSNDPTALVEIALAHGNLYFKELIYKRGLTNIINPQNMSQDSIEAQMLALNISKQATIWADPAEPKSIQDLHNCGWHNLKGADKGPDSIRAGIEIVNRYPLYVTQDSINLIKEKNNYKWKEKDGVLFNEPIDMFNHAIDALRYACFMELREYSGELGIYKHNTQLKENMTLDEILTINKIKAKNKSFFR